MHTVSRAGFNHLADAGMNLLQFGPGHGALERIDQDTEIRKVLAQERIGKAAISPRIAPRGRG